MLYLADTLCPPYLFCTTITRTRPTASRVSPAPYSVPDRPAAPRADPFASPLDQNRLLMTSAAELTAKWSTRLTEWRTLGVRVDGDKVAVEVLEDLRELVNDDVVTLAEASLLGGFSVGHLERLVRRGTIQNAGRKGRPRIRRSEIPSRPGCTLQLETSPGQLGSRRRMALAVITSTPRGD